MNTFARLFIISLNNNNVRNIYLIPVLSIVFLFWSCSDDDSDDALPQLNIPSNYESSSFDANASKELQITDQLATLTSAVQAGRSGATLDLSNLENLYGAGASPLNSLVTSYYDNLMRTRFLQEAVNASGNVYDPAVTGTDGGVLGAYLFNGNGLEPEQMIEKGQFGATLYNTALDILNADMTAADVDRLVALYGANPDFPNTDQSASVSNPDKFMAKYAARRDKNDGNGLYSQIKTQFIRLKAAIEAGSEYNSDKEDAIAQIKILWEKINAATVINYCHAVVSKMSATNPSDDDKGSALHSYSEAVGFLHGWKTIPQSHKLISDTKIDELLAKMLAPADGNETSYLFVTAPAENLPKLQNEVIPELQEIYNFTDQEIEDFKKNWVSEQGR